MNKKLGLAVAGALLAASTTASAGITIPAGDWTVDVGGNVNAFYSRQSTDTTTGAGTTTSAEDTNTIGTGLLPAQLGIGAKTRQNDLDIAFQFSFFTGTSSGAGNSIYGNTGQSALSGNTLNIRQAYLTFGDASWGTIKLGRDLGIYASDAILNDMTLLGVGAGTPGDSATLGRIGNGYMYADWKGQISYASPNWNGFSFAAGVMEGFTNGATAAAANQNLAYEGKVGYDFAANDVTGRVWVSGITAKHEGSSSATGNYTSKSWDIGGRLSYQGATLVGYYYDGDGIDSQKNGTLGLGGLQFLNQVKSQDSGGYVQATFVVPGIGTKLGASWGVSNSKNGTSFDIENESWIIGAYHPLTKSLNLVAEYINIEKTDATVTSGNSTRKTETDGFNLGAIMFF